MKSALVISFSPLSRAPRILRQIKWLNEDGWSVDALGLGPLKPDGVNEFFEMPLQPAFKRYFTYIVKRDRARFDSLFGQGVPKSLLSQIGKYDLIVLNELELAPLRELKELFGQAEAPQFFIDLHENHIASAASNWFERVAFERYWTWQYREFTNLVQGLNGRVSITSVEGRIASLYQTNLGRPVSIIRNAPAWADLEPSLPSNSQLRLVHHGMGTRNRGIEQSVMALKGLPWATLDLFLVSGWFYKAKVSLLAKLFRVSDRVTVHDPVNTEMIPAAINGFDLATVVIPPATENHLHALPNKFFESIQASLGVIVGPNPSMSSLVSQYKFGIVLENWSTRALVDALRTTTAEEIFAYKSNAKKESRRFSSTTDRELFLKLIGG